MKRLNEMNRIEKYYYDKMVKELNLPKVYIFSSTRECVNPIFSNQVMEIEKNAEGKIIKCQFESDKYPYEISSSFELVKEGVYREDLYFTGPGDCWDSSCTICFSKKDAKIYHQKETERINEVYSKSKK